MDEIPALIAGGRIGQAATIAASSGGKSVQSDTELDGTTGGTADRHSTRNSSGVCSSDDWRPDLETGRLPLPARTYLLSLTIVSRAGFVPWRI